MNKKLIPGLFCLLTLTSFSSAQTIIPGGDVYGVWDAQGSPYLIQGEITVPDNQMLTIEPAVEVNFQGHYKLIVDGYLEANGTENDPILFTADNTTEGWHGIRFINCHDTSHISYCIIEYGNANGSNYDAYGGGIYCDNTNPAITHCTIRNNSAGEIGGGIFCWDANPVITFCEISSNTAPWGGGISSRGNSNPFIAECDVHDNTVSANGGGVYFASSAGTLTNCEIYHNTALNAGGGISCSAANPEISFCSIHDNESKYGGGIAVDWEECNPMIMNCAIYNNHALRFGGGISCCESNPTVKNCTISGNEVTFNGGAMSFVTATALILNTIVEGNAGYGGMYFYESPMVTIRFSDFYNNEQGAFAGTVPPGLGDIQSVNANGDPCDGYFNIYLDPLFYATSGDSAFYLTEDSPCIDAGDPLGMPDPDGTVADMGAIYYDQGPRPNMTVDIEPVNPPVQVHVGDTFEFTIIATNHENDWVNFDIWILWDEMALTYGPANRDLPGNFTSQVRTFPQQVPYAPPGIYTYNAYIGDYPFEVWHYDYFNVEVLIGGDLIGPTSGWTVNSFGDWLIEVSVSQELEVSADFIETKVCPNPFNPTTALSYKLQAASFVNLTVYDIVGREVAELVNGWRDAGTHEVAFNGSDLASGVYIYRLELSGSGTAPTTVQGKMVLLK